MRLGYSGIRGNGLVIATAALARADFPFCEGGVTSTFTYASSDLAVIGDAITEGAAKLDRSWVGEWTSSRGIVALDVVVDRFWRGNGIGPALVWFAADALVADVMFLLPSALPTRVEPDGVCRSDSYLRRPGPDAPKKVRQAWRRAGFRNLHDGVMWLPTNDGMTTVGHCERARERLAAVQQLATQPRFKAWFRRRLARIERGRQA